MPFVGGCYESGGYESVESLFAMKILPDAEM